MKAVRVHGPTGIKGLSYEEAPDATPGLCDVLVKVAACGITHNELDWPIWTCRAGHQRTSIIPGNEVSGVVAALSWPSSPAWSTRGICAPRSARYTRSPGQPRRTARKPSAASRAGSSSSPDPGLLASASTDGRGWPVT